MSRSAQHRHEPDGGGLIHLYREELQARITKNFIRMKAKSYKLQAVDSLEDVVCMPTWAHHARD